MQEERAVVMLHDKYTTESMLSYLSSKVEALMILYAMSQGCSSPQSSL